MAKSILQVIAAVIAERYGLKSSEATAFVAAFFDQIREGLEADKLVKVRGLGTFKLQAVKPRESVNVNTGERVVISGHDKMAFTPDNALKELVNRPFADFETTIIKEGVDLDTIPTPVEEETTVGGNEEEEVAQPVPTEQEQAPDTLSSVAPGDAFVAQKEVEKEEMQLDSAVSASHSAEAHPRDEVATEPRSEVSEVHINKECGVDSAEVESSVPAREAPAVSVEPDHKVAEGARKDEAVNRPLTASERFSQLMDEQPIGETKETEQENREEKTPEQAAVSEEMSESPASLGQERPSTPVAPAASEADEAKPREEEKAAVTPAGGASSSPQQVAPSSVEASTEAQTEDTVEEENDKGRRGRIMVVAIAVVLTLSLIGIAAYYYLRPVPEATRPANTTGVAKPKSAAPKSAPAKDTVSSAAEHPAEPATVDAAPSADETDNMRKSTPEGVDLERANSYRPIRYGAYRIVGIAKTVVLRKGETMEKYCRRTLGKDMIGYFEAVNGVGRHMEGDTILVPKVELRPEYRK